MECIANVIPRSPRLKLDSQAVDNYFCGPQDSEMTPGREKEPESEFLDHETYPKGEGIRSTHTHAHTHTHTHNNILVVS